MADTQLVGFLAATFTFTSPILIVALGELIAERSGVFNLGVEGIMLTGALVGVFMTGVLNSPWLGLVAAMVVGVGIAFIHAYLTVSLKSDQIISGLMITILAGGVTTFIDVSYSFPQINGFKTLSLPLVDAVPLMGDVVARMYPTDILALLLVPVVWYLFKTDLGLRIISVGDNPAAADSMGISVRNTRYLSVLVGGAFAALGGAVMGVASVGFFGAGLTAGRGFVAIGVVVFAAWRPLWTLPGALLFGAFASAGTRGGWIRGFIDAVPLPSQIADVLNVLTHSQLMNVYPFLVTILALILMAWLGSAKTTYPQAIMQPYYRESE